MGGLPESVYEVVSVALVCVVVWVVRVGDKGVAVTVTLMVSVESGGSLLLRDTVLVRLGTCVGVREKENDRDGVPVRLRTLSVRFAVAVGVTEGAVGVHVGVLERVPVWVNVSDQLRVRSRVTGRLSVMERLLLRVAVPVDQVPVRGVTESDRVSLRLVVGLPDVRVQQEAVALVEGVRDQDAVDVTVTGMVGSDRVPVPVPVKVKLVVRVKVAAGVWDGEAEGGDGVAVKLTVALSRSVTVAEGGEAV